MANANTSKKSQSDTIASKEVKAKEDLQKDLQDEISKKDQTIADLNKKLEEVLCKFEQLQTQSMRPIQVVTEAEKDIEVTIGCNIYTGGTISSKDENILYKFRYSEEKEIPLSELRECFRSPINNYRNLFRDGVFYFIDKKYYKEFKIQNVLNFEEKYLIEKLLEDGIPYEKEIGTGSKANFNVHYTLLYKVADLYRLGKLKEWSYDSRSKFEKFFGMPLDKVVSDIQAMQEVFK